MTVISSHKYRINAELACRKFNRKMRRLRLSRRAQVYEYERAVKGRSGRYKVEVRGRVPIDG